ncbi:MAG: hypothetical protein JW925_06470 [Syntrophaceae bacterium]|nr:hypothetical protein [Syntrophaceae bacterium]
MNFGICSLALHEIEKLRTDSIAVFLFEDVVPLRGMAGMIDWRLNGMISREIKKERIRGDYEEKIIIPFLPRIGSEMLLLFGLGKVSDINYGKIYNASYLITQTVDKMALDSCAFDLYGQGRLNLVTSNITEAVVTGIFDVLSSNIEKLSNMKACLVTSSSHLQDVSLGLKQFKTNVNDRGSVDISTLEEIFVLS